MQMLRDLGLTDSESKVYEALLRLGTATRGSIVDTSGIAGSKVYEVLEKLHEKGLVTIYIENKVKHFRASSPKQLLSYLEERKQTVAQLEVQAHTMLPTLLALYNEGKEDQEVELYSGLKGLEIVFREQIDALKAGETCYVIGGTRGSDEKDIQAFFQKVHVWRQEKKIKTKMLFNKAQKQSTEELYSTQKYAHTLTRYIEHTSPVAINVYADHTAIIIFSKKLSTIHIKSTDVASSFKEYFELLWRTAEQ
jgi:sugar-specific transcriptional regulator TrmB